MSVYGLWASMVKYTPNLKADPNSHDLIPFYLFLSSNDAKTASPLCMGFDATSEPDAVTPSSSSQPYYPIRSYFIPFFKVLV